MSLEEVLSLSSDSSSPPLSPPSSPSPSRSNPAPVPHTGTEASIDTAQHYTLLATCLNESKLFNIRVQRNHPVLIGRGKQWTNDPATDEFVTDIRIPDGEISSKHCTIGEAETSGICVQDLSSLNGTALNGASLPVSTRHPLALNDELALGKSIVKVIPCVCSTCDTPDPIQPTSTSTLNRNINPKQSSSPVSTCMICGISLTSFTLARRQRHINECCSRSLGPSAKASPSGMPEKKKHKAKSRSKTKGRKANGVRCEGSVEEVEQRIREIDRDISSLQAHRALLVKHLEEMKKLQQHKQTFVSSQEEASTKAAANETLTNVLFHNSQDNCNEMQTDNTNNSPTNVHTLLPIAESKQTSLWTLTGTCQVEEEHIPAIAVDRSLPHQNDLNQGNVNTQTESPQLVRAKTVTDGDIVQALTKSKRNEKLYHNILVGNVVELETIQHAIAVVTEKRVPVARLVRFLDKQGITYKQY